MYDGLKSHRIDLQFNWNSSIKWSATLHTHYRMHSSVCFNAAYLSPTSKGFIYPFYVTLRFSSVSHARHTANKALHRNFERRSSSILKHGNMEMCEKCVRSITLQSYGDGNICEFMKRVHSSYHTFIWIRGVRLLPRRTCIDKIFQIIVMPTFTTCFHHSFWVNFSSATWSFRINSAYTHRDPKYVQLSISFVVISQFTSRNAKVFVLIKILCSCRTRTHAVNSYLREMLINWHILGSWQWWHLLSHFEIQLKDHDIPRI